MTTLTLTFENGEEAGDGIRRFDPGSVVRGRLDVMVDQPQKARRIEVWLAWHTTGRGDTDRGTYEAQVVHEGDLDPTGNSFFTFALNLPFEPWSYAGHYLNIIWVLHAKIDIPWGSDITANQRIIMRPSVSATDEIPSDAFADASTKDPFSDPYADSQEDPFARPEEDPFAKPEEDPFGYDPFKDEENA